MKWLPWEFLINILVGLVSTGAYPAASETRAELGSKVTLGAVEFQAAVHSIIPILDIKEDPMTQQTLQEPMTEETRGAALDDEPKSAGLTLDDEPKSAGLTLDDEPKPAGFTLGDDS